jgi:hypothetical protein
MNDAVPAWSESDSFRLFLLGMVARLRASRSVVASLGEPSAEGVPTRVPATTVHALLGWIALTSRIEGLLAVAAPDVVAAGAAIVRASEGSFLE